MRTHMKSYRIVSILLVFVFIFALAGCQSTNTPTENGGQISQNAEKTNGAPSDNTTESLTEHPSSESKALVVYFSRTGEQYRVGVIDKGNTAIVAEMIAEKTGADMYEILPETDYYPYTYSELTDVAKKEQNENARPKIKNALPDISEYDIIFIGAPVWWGDWPMICYTFFEGVDLSGKKLVPFSTHEGSGLSGFDKKLASAAPGAEVLTGLAVRGEDCQKKQDSVKSSVNDWLAKLGY